MVNVCVGLHGVRLLITCAIENVTQSKLSIVTRSSTSTAAKLIGKFDIFWATQSSLLETIAFSGRHASSQFPIDFLIPSDRKLNVIWGPISGPL